MSDLIILGWLACSVLTFGIVRADHWHSYPTLRSPESVRQDTGHAVAMALFGPLSLLIVFLLTGFAQHGLMYRTPK